MDAMLRALNAPRQLALRIPFSASGVSIATRVESIEAVEAAAAELRRAACGRAAAARLNGDSDSDELDLAPEEEEEGVAVQTIRVQTLPVAATIGGKLWDASLLMAAWAAESASSASHFPPPAAPGERAPRVLELGAGLGIVGLAVAKAYPHLDLTLTDYDPALLANLHENLRLNGMSSSTDTINGLAPAAGRGSPHVASVDFRDFTRRGASEVPLPAALQRCADAGLLSAVDLGTCPIWVACLSERLGTCPI